MVHYLGGYVTPDHWQACKACLVFQAGCLVSMMSCMSKATMQSTILEGYNSIVGELDELHFGADARAFFLSSFRKKEEPMTGEPLYRYFQDSRNKMCSLLVPLLPQEFMTMKSGRGFHQTCTEVIVNQFRKELIKTVNGRPGVSKEEAASRLPPQFWEYKKAPWIFFLCVKIFRRHPQLAPNVADVLGDVTNQTMSRAALKRKAQIAKFQKLQGDIDSTSNKNKVIKHEEGTAVDKVAAVAAAAKQVAESNRNLQRSTWAKVHMAKAMEESANVARKLGEIEAFEKKLAFLDRLRPVIGEEEYMARVRLLLGSLPDPKKFSKDCEVIIIDDIDIDDSRKNKDRVEDQEEEGQGPNDDHSVSEDEDLTWCNR